MATRKKYWIQGAVKNKGALRSALGVNKSGKIPVSKLKKAAKGNSTTARRARLALTLRKLNQGKRKKR